MSEGKADHSVACFAQGYSDDGLKYTVFLVTVISMFMTLKKVMFH
jgi:hypothetical protein